MRKMRILAIDDNTVNLATIEQELKAEYEIIPMITGRRAIKYLYCEKVDLILLDVQMPVMDGVQTLKEIRKLENGVTTPVIFLTAMKDKDTVIEGSKLGIMDYITKPFDAEDLKKRIEHVFKRLGIKPVEKAELVNSIGDILSLLENGKSKQAGTLMDEISGYQVSEEILGRIKNVRTKLDKGDTEAALIAIRKLFQMINANGSSFENNSIMMTTRELYSKILYIQECVSDFKTKEAIKECQQLTHYVLPEGTHDDVDDIMKKIIDYDDIEAEAAIERLLEKLNDESV